MTALVAAYMGTVTAAVVAGASLSQLLLRRPGPARKTLAFSAGVMLAVCLLYLIPDALAFQHGITVPRPRGSDHASIGFALSLGFLSLLSVERYLLRGSHEHTDLHGAHPHHGGQGQGAGHHTHAHTHTHDPAPSSRPRQPGVVWPTLVALWLHGLFDGVALYAAGVMPQMGGALAVALILHKVPESATLLAVMRRGGATQRQRLGALLLYLVATPLGMAAAAQLLLVLSENGVSLLMAFVAGSLLHLVTGHLLPEVTHSGRGHGHATTAAAASSADASLEATGCAGTGFDAAAAHEDGGGIEFPLMLAGFAVLVVARYLGAD